MRYEDIKRHLQPFNISRRRKTTINHAFASAVAPCDDFDDKKVRAAIQLLGQNPDEDLKCVYCDKPSETWDHVFATVKDSDFSGAGHRLGNLLPCCKQCNSSKGNKQWEQFLHKLYPESDKLSKKVAAIQGYLDKLFVKDLPPADMPEYREFQKVKKQILSLMNQADALAAEIRTKAKAASIN
jgi:5-methylcytosine-specific restriction endonuclease McrA